MNGAREYASLFQTGQYGCLYITPGEHARGKTFHIQVLPKGEKAKENGPNMCLNEDAVEVYGIVSGQPGWTEVYGWKEKGPWQADFERLAESFRLAKADKERKDQATTDKIEKAKRERKEALLRDYDGIDYDPLKALK